MNGAWFDKWHDQGVGFFLHGGPHANVPAHLRDEFAKEVFPDHLEGMPIGREWQGVPGGPSKYEIKLPPEYHPHLRDWCDEHGKLERPIYAT